MNLEHIPRQLQLTRVDVHPSVVDKGASSSHDCISQSMQDTMSPVLELKMKFMIVNAKLKIMCSST